MLASLQNPRCDPSFCSFSTVLTQKKVLPDFVAALSPTGGQVLYGIFGEVILVGLWLVNESMKLRVRILRISSALIPGYQPEKLGERDL